ncbi:MAG: hypothetical protein J6Q30_06385 [Oscillospiraceae bacterium]|nr:hypothetical protein [Oscillospiraceae bacterium]
MSKITKLLAMLLALVLVVSLFAGCTPEDGPTKETQAPTQGTENKNPTNGNDSDNDQVSAEVPVENDMFPLAKPVTFRIAIRGQKEYQSLIERCEWYKYLVEKTNVRLQCIVLGDDYMENLNILISANVTPDAILGPDTLSSAQVVDFADQGKLHSLEQWITDPKIMPNYQKALEAVPGALSKMTNADGHIWSLSGLSEAEGTAWDSPLTVNIEWLKQVPGYEDGKTFPQTVEEFTNVLRYFKTHDMNGNGDVNDEIPLLMVSSSDAGDAKATLQGLMNLWGLSTTDSSGEYYVHVNDEGVCALAPQTQNYRDCLTWINTWWKEGLIWNKFFDNVSAEELAAVAGAETASWGFFNGETWFNNGSEDNGNLAWRDAQTLVVPFNTGYETRYFLNPSLQGNLNALTIFKTCKNPHILLAWMDQFFTLAGTRSAESGMPNEWTLWNDSDDYKDYYTQNPTWYIDSDGSLKYPSAENTSWVDLNTYDATLATKQSTNHPTWNAIFNLNDVFKCITPEAYMNGQWESNQNSEAYVLGKFMEENASLFDHNAWPRACVSEAEQGDLDFLWADIKLICARYEKAFITGELRLNNSNWNTFQKELEYAGINDLVAQLQIIWDRYSA